jgi:hypothetical protein
MIAECKNFKKRKIQAASVAAQIIFSTVTSATTNHASALGIVSRSCLAAGAQESVAVDWNFNSYWLWTASYHYRDGQLIHGVDGIWENTWRSYAGHLGTEFWYGRVVGSHYIIDMGTGQERYLGISEATDCNLSKWGTE